MTEQILAVQRMQDYIEKNKTEEISLSDLARASLFSPWYAYRLFRDCLGLTPNEYIRKYRLTQAAKQLRRGAVKVIDAALDAGFSNADTFTRAFFREFGLNPSDYMKNPVPIIFFIPYGAKYRELRKENIDVSNISSSSPASLLRAVFRNIGLSGFAPASRHSRQQCVDAWLPRRRLSPPCSP